MAWPASYKLPDAVKRKQHFLLSPAARDLPIASIARLTEGEADAIFCAARWEGGQPTCPRCGCTKAYRISDRPGWNCAKCRKHYTVTSGSALHQTKLSKSTILLAIALYAQEAKGKAALPLSAQLGVGYKPIYVLLHKIRECMAIEAENVRLTGAVELDSATYGGKIIKENWKRRPGGKRLLRWHSRDRQVVVVARQRDGRTRTWVVKRESQAILGLLRTIAADSTIFCDLAHAWDELGRLYETLRINHEEAYVTESASTNYVESFHSVMRRAEYGVHHRITGRYLSRYAAEFAWRQDHRRRSPRERFNIILSLLLKSGKSAQWTGYMSSGQAHAIPSTGNNIVRLPAITRMSLGRRKAA